MRLRTLTLLRAVGLVLCLLAWALAAVGLSACSSGSSREARGTVVHVTVRDFHIKVEPARIPAGDARLVIVNKGARHARAARRPRRFGAAAAQGRSDRRRGQRFAPGLGPAGAMSRPRGQGDHARRGGPSGARARAELQQLRVAGVRIAVDDFGPGFSSLGQLRSFRVDMIKVDRSVVQVIDEETRTPRSRRTS